MKRWLRILAIAVAVIAAAVGLRQLFPGDETRIQRLVAQAAKAASVVGNEGDLGRAIKAAEIASLCTADISIRVNTLGLHGGLEGRDAVRQAALQLANTFGNYRVLVDDVRIRERTEDTARLTLTASFEGNRPAELNAQEFELRLKKEEGRWRMAVIQTVNALRR